MSVKTSFSNLCTALKAVLSNKLDKSGGTLTGELTTKDVNVNGTVSQGNVYARKILGKLDIGTSYDNLDSKYKDGTYHRMWRIRFDSNKKDISGRIKVNLKASWNNFNAAGVMSKIINYGYSFSKIFANVGYYDSLGLRPEKDFRISEFIWNDAAKAWEILIWQKNLSGDNSPLVMLEFFGNIVDTTVLPVELTQMTSYTAPKASPTGGDKVVNLEDTPVFETPNGKEIATTDLATTSKNGLMSKDDKKKLDGMAAIVVDDSISTTSTNAIQNNAVGLKFQGVDSEISEINSTLASTANEITTIVNEYGSKNLVDTSLIPNAIKIGGGITRKNNGDGSITYSGTSTVTNAVYLPLMEGQNLGKGTYIFTPNPMTDETYTYQIYKDGRYWKNYVLTQTIEITEAGKYSIGLAIKSNPTISNTFKPMLRYAAIKDDTYVPYAMTNRELTEKVADTGWITTGNLKYRKSGYIVALQGSVTPSGSTMSITLGILPNDCRPSQDINIAQTETDTPLRRIIVQTDGNVVLLFSSNCTANHTYSYNGIFMV